MTQDVAYLDEATARAEIVRVGRSLFERGYVHSTAGNISVRLADGFLITQTDACLGFLQPDTLARLDAGGTQTGGEPASKTIALHRSIYAADPGARCVIHTHSTHLVAASIGGAWRDGDLLPPITPYYVMKVGHVPMIPYDVPGDPQVARQVAERIHQSRERGAPIRAVMLERLGPNVWQRTPAAAMALLDELEETARLWLLGGRSAEPLDETRIDALRKRFGAVW